MCTVPEEVVTLTCQISFYPLGRADYLPPIDRVLELIAASGLEHRVGEMSTVVTGPSDRLFALLRQLSEQLTAEGCGFAMPVTVSNVCGLG